MTHNAILQFNWSFGEAKSTTISELNQLFSSFEFKQFQEFKEKQFKALLKTIAGVK